MSAQALHLHDAIRRSILGPDTPDTIQWQRGYAEPFVAKVWKDSGALPPDVQMIEPVYENIPVYERKGRWALIKPDLDWLVYDTVLSKVDFTTEYREMALIVLRSFWAMDFPPGYDPVLDVMTTPPRKRKRIRRGFGLG